VLNIPFYEIIRLKYSIVRTSCLHANSLWQSNYHFNNRSNVERYACGDLSRDLRQYSITCRPSPSYFLFAPEWTRHRLSFTDLQRASVILAMNSISSGLWTCHTASYVLMRLSDAGDASELRQGDGVNGRSSTQH